MKYLRRFLFFIASRLFWVTVISALLIVAFYMAMNATNIHILLTDGMKARAGVILLQEDASELTKFFKRDYLESDEQLRVGMSDSSPYADYDIRSFDHRVTLEWMWSWPWENAARADFVEEVPTIDGQVKSARREEVVAAGGEAAIDPPAWPKARYRATLTRVDGQWKISNLQLIEYLP